MALIVIAKGPANPEPLPPGGEPLPPVVIEDIDD